MNIPLAVNRPEQEIVQALGLEKIAWRVDRAELGVAGATIVTTYRNSLGCEFEYRASNGGASFHLTSYAAEKAS